MGSTRVGIFGGTFDPIHFGHLRIAETAREHLGLDRVVFVPVGVPVHRAYAPRAGREHRFAMCLVATETQPCFFVSRVETDNPKPSYTVDTLSKLRKELGDAELHLIIGADEAAIFPTWREPRAILDMARLAVATRPGLEREDLCHCLPDWVIARLDILPPLAIDISATDIRARLAAGRSVRYLLPDEVRTHIEKYDLYRD